MWDSSIGCVVILIPFPTPNAATRQPKKVANRRPGARPLGTTPQRAANGKAQLPGRHYVIPRFDVGAAGPVRCSTVVRRLTCLKRDETKCTCTPNPRGGPCLDR